MMENNILTNWTDVNKTTLDLVRSIPNDKFHSKPFAPRFKSFSWEFSCVLTTRKGYIRGITSGKLDGACFVESDASVEKLSKDEMVKELEESGDIIKNIIKNDGDKEIDYFGTPHNLLSVISWLLQHEQLHYGKLILYFAKSEIEIPKCLKVMWGESNFN